MAGTNLTPPCNFFTGETLPAQTNYLIILLHMYLRLKKVWIDQCLQLVFFFVNIWLSSMTTDSSTPLTPRTVAG